MLAIIGAVISDIGRLIGIGGVLFIGLLLYKEDIPGANRIPFLPSIPILGDLTAGPVHTHAAQQVKLATDDLVTKFERDTLAWQLGEERRRATEAALQSPHDRLGVVVAEGGHRRQHIDLVEPVRGEQVE